MSREPDEEVLYAVQLYELCSALHVLPRAGGLLDQRYSDVVYLRLVHRVAQEKMELDAKKTS
jgi:hypothetical protein